MHARFHGSMTFDIAIVIHWPPYTVLMYSRWFEITATGWHRCGLQGGLQGGLPEGIWRLASSEPKLLYPGPPMYLLSLCFTGSGLQQPTILPHPVAQAFSAA